MWKRIGFLIVVAAAILLAVGYGFGYYTVNGKYLPGTIINGHDFSYVEPEAVSDYFQKWASSYAIGIKTRGGGVEKITADEMKMTYRGIGDTKQILDGQNHMLWFMGSKEDYHIPISVDIDRNALKSAINKLDCMMQMQVPVQARIVETNTGFQTVERIVGDYLDKEKVYTVVETAVMAGDISVDLESKGCYIDLPELTADDLKDKCDALNRMRDVYITYNFGEEKEVVDFNVVRSMIANYVLSRDKVKEYVTGLASEYDTVGIPRSFTTYDDKKVYVEGGDYGWKIDIESETDTLMDLIGKGAVEVHDPDYEKKAMSRLKNDVGYTYAEIDKSFGKFVLYVEGEPVIETIGRYEGNDAGCYFLRNTGSELAFGPNSKIVPGSVEGPVIEQEITSDGAQLMQNTATGPDKGMVFYMNEKAYTKLAENVKENMAIIIY